MLILRNPSKKLIIKESGNTSRGKFNIVQNTIYLAGAGGCFWGCWIAYFHKKLLLVLSMQFHGLRQNGKHVVIHTMITVKLISGTNWKVWSGEKH